MRGQTIAQLFVAILFSAFLTACGGGGPQFCTTGNCNPSSSSGGSSGGSSSSGSGTVTPVYAMGSLQGSNFSAGVIAVGTSPLDAGGSSGLSVAIVDTANGNALLTSPVQVTFSSPCAANGTALITSPVTTVSGSATSTYQAAGCSGTETIVAQANVGGTVLQASGNITVNPAPVSAIQFTSATPSSIRIKGTGDPQTAVIVFKVTNTAGGPVNKQKVKFTLDTTAGGIKISPATGTSDSNGLVQTVVTAGTVHTSVRVTATVLDSTGAVITDIPPAQSDSLVISTGLADQNSFSISVGCFNIEGNDHDGVKTNVNILAADRFNNPVPDGTAISFQSEGGQIPPQCLTTNGGCSVDFTTSEPRTADHRVTVLATAVGEESFVDTNGNGQYDAGEAFTDLPEASLDRNENGVRDSNEEFIDFNNNAKYDGPSGNFTGVLCKSGCDTATSLSVRASVPIIMAGSVATILINPSTIDLSNGTVAVQVTVGDSANQPMPGGTTIAASTSFGTIVGDASFTQLCSTFNGPFTYTFFVKPPDGQSTNDSGIFTVKVTTPLGTVTVAAAQVVFTLPVIVPPPPGNLKSINFVSAVPTTVGLKSSGTPEQSTVTFKVFDDNGVPLPGQTVNFSLDTTVGGITFTPHSAVSDSSGDVTTVVSSGTIHTSVRVTAKATSGSTTVTAVSDALVISTGIPDQDSFSISAGTLNIEGHDFDGITSDITVHLADRFNNPVPDGVAVAFTTDAGQIQPSCTTSGGACTVTLTSSNPRPPNHRAVILATAVGEESFTDLNGNGQFDAGEPFGDLPEAWRDDNESGARDANEEFLDFNGNNAYDGPSGNFTGVLCNSGCDAAHALHVRGTMVVVMSGSNPLDPASPSTVTPSSIVTPVGSQVTVKVLLHDGASQNMPAGTTISAATSLGGLAGAVTFTQQDSDANSGGTTYTFTYLAPATAGSGTLTFTVTTPQKVITLIQVPITAF